MRFSAPAAAPAASALAPLNVYRVPPPLAAWVEAGVVMHMAAAQRVSRFPAMAQAMLAVRLLPLVPSPTALPPSPPWPPGHAAAARGAGVLCGPVMFHTLSTEPVVHGHPGGITALGLLVRPAAAACLLARQGGALVNQALPWAELAGESENTRLEEALCHAGGAPAQLSALMASLQRVMRAVAPSQHEQTARLCAAVGRWGTQAAGPLAISPRQLQRRCQAALGLAPKPFQRLVRFQQALAGAVAHGAGVGSRTLAPQVAPAAPAASMVSKVPLAPLAQEAGYFDQSHLARDSRQFAGVSLGALVGAARTDSDWWPLATRLRLETGVMAERGA